MPSEQWQGGQMNANNIAANRCLMPPHFGEWNRRADDTDDPILPIGLGLNPPKGDSRYASLAHTR